MSPTRTPRCAAPAFESWSANSSSRPSSEEAVGPIESDAIEFAVAAIRPLNSSSMWARMMSSKFVSARNPRAPARRASNAPGHAATMRAIVSSGSCRIKATASSPAARRSASIWVATVADTPGIVRQRCRPRSTVSRAAAWTRKPTPDRGDANQCRTSVGTGNVASSPLSGSRMMLEKKPDAAWFGLPGRTQIVGRRRPMPSMNPRRL